MQINPLSIAVQQHTLKAESALEQSKGDFQEVLARAQREQDEPKLKQACQDIEAMFIQQMFKQMRATVPRGGLIPESMGTKIYEEMLDAEYSKLMASSPDNFGIAEMLYQQLKAQE